MSSLRSGRGLDPVPMSIRRAPSRAILLATAVALAGCSQHTSQQTAAYDPRVAAPPYHVSPDAGRKPDLEDDGREAQLPPLKKPRPEPDDPREPWSPNYGKAAPVQRADAAVTDREAVRPTGWSPVVRGPVPHDLPADFRRKLASAAGE